MEQFFTGAGLERSNGETAKTQVCAGYNIPQREAVVKICLNRNNPRFGRIYEEEYSRE
jgi:hypothetical protein